MPKIWGKQLLSQVFSKPRSLIIASAIIGLIGIIPGMPHVAFIILSAGLAGIAYLFINKEKEKSKMQADKEIDLTQARDPVVSELILG